MYSSPTSPYLYGSIRFCSFETGRYSSSQPGGTGSPGAIFIADVYLNTYEALQSTEQDGARVEKYMFKINKVFGIY